MIDFKELTNGNYYIYQISDGGCGIVKAETEAEAKLRAAFSYHKHGQPDVHSWDVEVFEIDKDGYQEDCPYLIELGWDILF